MYALMGSTSTRSSVARSARAIDGSRAGWRGAAACADVIGPAAGVIGEFDVVGRGGEPCLMGVEHLLQITTTPAAARPGAETLAHLRRSTRPLDPQEVDELPLRDVKTEANFVVELHVSAVASC